MGTALATVTDDTGIDPVTRLALGWLAGKRSANTRTAYGRDLGVLAVAKPGRAPSWLAWCATAGISPLAATEDHVNVYARLLDQAGLSAATRARKLSAVSGWYGWLTKRGHLAANPAADIARPAVDPDASTTPGLTRDQAVALLAAARSARGPQQARTTALVTVLLLTGCRVNEAVGADVADLGTDRGHRVLWVTRKGGKRQALALPAPAAGAIDAYLASRDDLSAVPALPGQPGDSRSRPLFATASGGRLLPADIWHLIRRLGRHAGLPDDLARRLGPHALRHSYATLALDSGVSLRDLQDSMGHADPRTTRRYDRSRRNLDRAPGYALAGYLAAQD